MERRPSWTLTGLRKRSGNATRPKRKGTSDAVKVVHHQRAAGQAGQAARAAAAARRVEVVEEERGRHHVEGAVGEGEARARRRRPGGRWRGAPRRWSGFTSRPTARSGPGEAARAGRPARRPSRSPRRAAARRAAGGARTAREEAAAGCRASGSRSAGRRGCAAPPPRGTPCVEELGLAWRGVAGRAAGSRELEEGQLGARSRARRRPSRPRAPGSGRLAAQDLVEHEQHGDRAHVAVLGEHGLGRGEVAGARGPAARPSPR